MAVSYATFDRLKSKGVAAYRRGDYPAAKAYLVDAAESLIELAETTPSSEVRRQHEELAAELIDLARDCDRLQKSPRKRAARQREQEEEPGAEASDWIIRDKPNVSFDDIAGLEEVKLEIRMKMIYPFAHPELARQYGISLGGGVLLYGPPGTGKTMIAKAIAHEVDATIFVISPAQLLSKWVGEAEQNVRKLFEAARSEARSVIFLDEAEALVPKRQSDTSSVMQRVVPQILQELEGFDRDGERALLFLGATNKPWLLDDAMMRPGRLDSRIYVPLPDAPARFRLLEISFGNRPLADDVDFGDLCDRLEGYSGADIKHIAQRAAREAFMEAVSGKGSRPIRHADILAVLAVTPPSVHPSTLSRFEQFAQSGQ